MIYRICANWKNDESECSNVEAKDVQEGESITNWKIKNCEGVSYATLGECFVNIFNAIFECWDVGKEKQRVEGPCHAALRPIVEESPQTAH